MRWKRSKTEQQTDQAEKMSHAAPKIAMMTNRPIVLPL